MAPAIEIGGQNRGHVLKQIRAQALAVGLVHVAQHRLLDIFRADQLQIGQDFFDTQ